MIGSITGGAMGTVGTIFSSIAGIKWDKEMSKLKDQDPAYKISPYAKNTLGLANTLLNGRMAGATEAERNIMANKASSISNINSNATDASQALSLAAGAGATADQNFQNLSVQEQQDYMNRLNNWNKANSIMTDEHHNEFDDIVRRWQDQVNVVTAQYKARKKGGEDWANLGSYGSGNSGSGMK